MSIHFEYESGELVIYDDANEVTRISPDGLFGDGAVRSAIVEATLAEINAGKVLLSGIEGKVITVHDFTMLFTGSFTTATSIALSDTNDTPISIGSLAIAGATDGAIVKPNHANMTVGAGFLGALTESKGITIGKTGSAAAGGTKVTVAILYTVDG